MPYRYNMQSTNLVGAVPVFVGHSSCYDYIIIAAAMALHEQQLASTHSHLLRLYNHSKWLCSLREANYFRALKTDFRV